VDNVFGAKKESGRLNVAIIIDPWKRDILNHLFFFISDKRRVLTNIKNFVIEKQIDLVIVASYDNLPVDKIILSIPNKKIFTTKIKEVKNIIDEKNIKQIYICGMAWEKCVKYRELGYLSLHKNTNADILVKDNCVLCDEDYPARMFVPDENPEWKKTTDYGIYKYEP
jgi:hypothetical protein